jgi:hypothetical protein
LSYFSYHGWLRQSGAGSGISGTSLAEMSFKSFIKKLVEVLLFFCEARGFFGLTATSDVVRPWSSARQDKNMI